MRWFRRKKEPSFQERVAAIRELIGMIYDEESVDLWMITPNHLTAGRAPIDVIADDRLEFVEWAASMVAVLGGPREKNDRVHLADWLS